MKFATDLYVYWKDKPVSNFFLRGFTCDVFLIDQGDELWLIDTGVEVFGRSKRIVKQIQRDGLDPNKIKRVFLTHAHSDHMNAVGFFDRIFHPTFYVHEADKPYFENGLQYLLDAQLAQAVKYKIDLSILPMSPRMITLATNYTMGKMPQLTNEMIIHDGQIIKGSRYELHVIHTPGHLPGHCCYWIPQLKVMFLGDLLDPDYDHKPPMNLATSNYDDFVSSITKLLSYQAEYFCGAHTKKIHTGIDHNHEQVTGTLKQLEFIKQRVIEILKQNASTGTQIKQFNGKFPKTLFQNVEPMAAGFAVIRSLMAQGKIRQEGERFYYIEK